MSGSEASVSAVRYAQDEAVARGVRLVVAHVVAGFVPVPHSAHLPPDELLGAAQTLVSSVVDRVEPVPAQPVEVVVRRGAVVPTLVSLGARACTVVLGADHRPLVDRVLTGDVSAGVAAAASATVVCVPRGWSPAGEGPVVAAVRDAEQVDGLLDEALVLAQRRRRPLVVVHAWRHHLDDVTGGLGHGERRTGAAGGVADAVSAWRDHHPGVAVDLVTVEGPAGREVVAACEGADEVVLVRRPGGHLGSTARAVLHRARCPVRVLPPHRG